MAVPRPIVFVCGVTGFQGGAVARHLLKLNWGVHAVARNPDSKRAMALSAAGAVLTKGDWDDEASLRSSMVGCSKMFFNLAVTPDDFDRERRQAMSIVKIAREVGIDQVVASTSLGVSLYNPDSTLNIDRRPALELLEIPVKIKKAVEETVENGSFDSVTIIRPGYFMTNFLEPTINEYSEILDNGTWSTLFEDDTRIGLVDYDDIAKLAIVAFQNSELLHGRAIGLVSELLTPQELLDYLSQAMGSPGFKAIYLTEEEMASLTGGSSGNPYVTGDKCLNAMGDLVDMQELANLIPLTSFEGFLKREGASVKKMHQG